MITVNATSARIPAKAASAKLNKTDWKVLHAIALHADENGRSFPGMARISQITKVKRHHVAEAIKRIEAAGIMRHSQTPGPNGGWRANHYELIYEPLGDFPSSRNSPATGTSPYTGNTPAKVLPTEGTPYPLHREHPVPSGGTLTNQLTNQGTSLYQEEGGKGVEGINGAGVLSIGNTSRVLSGGDTPSCRWPLGAGCLRPATPGSGFCDVHGPR